MTAHRDIYAAAKSKARSVRMEQASAALVNYRLALKIARSLRRDAQTAICERGKSPAEVRLSWRASVRKAGKAYRISATKARITHDAAVAEAWRIYDAAVAEAADIYFRDTSTP